MTAPVTDRLDNKRALAMGKLRRAIKVNAQTMEEYLQRPGWNNAARAKAEAEDLALADAVEAVSEYVLEQIRAGLTHG
jgi:hypothetical protein